MRLRYTGGGPTVFVEVPTEVEPGDVFEAPPDLAERLLQRADVEQIDESAVDADKPAKSRKAARPEVEAAQPVEEII